MDLSLAKLVLQYADYDIHELTPRSSASQNSGIKQWQTMIFNSSKAKAHVASFVIKHIDNVCLIY